MHSSPSSQYAYWQKQQHDPETNARMACVFVTINGIDCFYRFTERNGEVLLHSYQDEHQLDKGQDWITDSEGLNTSMFHAGISAATAKARRVFDAWDTEESRVTGNEAERREHAEFVAKLAAQWESEASRIPTYLNFYLQPSGSTGRNNTEFEANLQMIDGHFEDIEWFFRAFQSLVVKMTQGSEIIQRIGERHPLLGQLPLLPLKRFVTIDPSELPLNVRNHLALIWRFYRLYDRRRLLSALEQELQHQGVSVLQARTFHMEMRKRSMRFSKEPDRAASADVLLEMLDQPVDIIEWLVEVRLGQFLMGHYQTSRDHDLAFHDWRHIVRSVLDTIEDPSNPIGDLQVLFRDDFTLNVGIDDTVDRCAALLAAVLAHPALEHDDVVSFLAELPNAVVPSGTRQRIVLGFERISMSIDPIGSDKVTKSVVNRLQPKRSFGFFGMMRAPEVQASHWQHLNVPVQSYQAQRDVLCPWPWGATQTNDPPRGDGASLFYEITLPWSKCKEYCLRVLNSHLENKRQSLAYGLRDWNQILALSKVIAKLESLPASDAAKMVVSEDELWAWIGAEGRSSDANGPYRYPRSGNNYATLLVVESMAVLAGRSTDLSGIVRHIDQHSYRQ